MRDIIYDRVIISIIIVIFLLYNTVRQKFLTEYNSYYIYILEIIIINNYIY